MMLSQTKKCRTAFRAAQGSARVLGILENAARKARPIYLKKFLRKYDLTSNLSG
jgi:hypothetical protein